MKHRGYSNFSFQFVICLLLLSFVANPAQAASGTTAQAAGGTISGTTFAADGVTPLPHIAVSIRDVNNTFSDIICSDANGHYQITGVPFGLPVRVRADAYPDAWCNAGAQYRSKYWGETLNNGPTLVTLTGASPQRTGINFSMSPLGSVPIPFIAGWHQDGFVEAFDWPAGTHLKLRVEDPATPLSPDLLMETDVPNSPAPDSNVGRFNLNGRFDLQPGMILMVSGAYISKIIVIDPLTITGIDQAQDTISGTTGAGNWMWMWFEPSCCRPIIANASGIWMVDYSVPGPNGEPVADIGVGATGAIHVPSGDGRTSLAWAVLDPNIDVWYQDGIIEAFEWPVGTHLTLQIEDPATLLSPDFSMESNVTGSVPTSAIFNVKGRFDIQPGMIVRVYGEYMSRQIVVDNLTITDIDQGQDTITGTTAPNNWMWMWFEPSCCRPIIANASGIWTVDYSVPGPNGEPVANIGPGSTGAIHVPGGEGKTSLLWSIPVAVRVYIGSSPNPVGSYALNSGESTRKSFIGVNNGPVKILDTESVPLMSAARMIYKVNGTKTSFAEMMGLPDSQLDNIYWLPWYNNIDLDTQLRIGNVSNSTATIYVYIAGTLMTPTPITLAPGASTRKRFASNNGPVKIVSNQNIVAAERVIYNVNDADTSFTEMMALPNSQLDNIYWLPWYNNKDLDTQLRIANVSASNATVHVTIGGQEMTGSPFAIPTGVSIRKSFPGIDKGPVKVVSTQNIVVAERVIYKVNGLNTSFTEMIGLPNNQIDNIAWLPWYNNKDLDTQLRIANVSASNATVHVYIGGQEMTGSPFALAPGTSTRRSFAGIDKGPVKVVSTQNIVVAERVIYKVNGLNTSFTEMIGLPDSQLDTTYWLPWYNNVDLDTQLRFGVP